MMYTYALLSKVMALLYGNTLLCKVSILCYTVYTMREEGKQACPITRVAELLSDTWTMLIMRALTEGPKRFCELEEWLGNISTRTLTLKLKRLTTLGLVAKQADGSYVATKKGAGLKIIERAMVTYSQKYLD